MRSFAQISQALGINNLPSDLISRVLEGFEKSTTESFRHMCSTLRVSFLSSFMHAIHRNMSLHSQLTNLLRDLESTYLDLKAGGKWVGAGSEGLRASASAFNAGLNTEEVDLFGDNCEEYAIYKAATPANRRLPFKEWVKSATCKYCDNVGHIRPDCRKRKADLRRSINEQRSPDLPAPSSASTTLAPKHPSSEIKASPAACLRDHPQFKALKAAFDMLSGSNGEISDEAHAAILEEDVSELMCALGLKE